MKNSHFELTQNHKIPEDCSYTSHLKKFMTIKYGQPSMLTQVPPQ